MKIDKCYILNYYKHGTLKIALTRTPDWCKKTVERTLGNEVAYFNNCFYLCRERKPLKEFAESLRAEWIKEVENNLAYLKEMKI